jgi:cation diffusion facilitator CzcD-associated flavoprotein CzcO
VHGQYATSLEIWKYIKSTATKWELEQFVQYNARATDSIWDDNAGKWKLKFERDGQQLHDECDILVNATGILKSVFTGRMPLRTG